MQEDLALLERYGTCKAASDATGITYNTLNSRIHKAIAWRDRDPAAQAAMDAIGTTSEPRFYWAKTDKEGNVTYSVLIGGTDDGVSFEKHITDTLDAYRPLDRKLFAPRINTGAKSDNLAVIDLADVHFQKLCVKEETNYTYNVEVARHRVIEGTRRLLQKIDGAGRIMFVMGNDILHTDNGKTTTSGTPQDSDGTYFTAWRAAQHASIDAISECAAVADVDLIHCMSNHDWRSGWALSQTIAAALRGHEGVRATPYNLSERHRKYYGYGRNGFLLTHGDGAKEEKLTSLFLKEAREMIVKTDLLYAILHHFHHKSRVRRGIDVFQGEKDHTAFTQINMGAARVEGGDMMAEYVRSPSPPDGWHDRNGYVNRQAVEAFVHCPNDGQIARHTEWF
jgi:hypothetical protein